MPQNDLKSVYFVSVYLLLYCILLQIESTFHYAFMMLLFSPILIFWMVYTVLRYGRYNGGDLGNRESGYQDRSWEEDKDR